MPLLWRQLIKSYLRVFLLCLMGFITLLLVLRFQDIARFAASGAPRAHLFKFIAYQIPYILPLAIPVSCLISAILLFQNMSRHSELTALRASGFGLFPIIFPVLFCGLFLTLINFTISSEITQRCRAASKSLARQITRINPLCILHKEKFVKLNDSYIDMKVLKSGNYSEDVIFIMPSLSNQRLGLIIAKKLYLKGANLIGENVTFISSLNSKIPEGYDHLMIENQTKMKTESSKFARYLHSNDWNLRYHYLSLRMFQAKRLVEKNAGIQINSRAFQEICRSISLSLATLTLTLIGVAFGIESAKKSHMKNLFWAISLTAFFIISLMGAKSIRHDPLMLMLCYLLPHLLIIVACIWKFQFIERGEG